MSDSGWIFVDDRDPGIAYFAAPGSTLWHGGVSQEYDQTTTGLESGDTLTYYFNASSIGVFGTYGPTGPTGPPIALYQVDNSAATTVTGPITQATLYRQTFWTSDPKLSSLAPGSFHKLFVSATVPNTTLWVDYLAYPPATSGTTSTTASIPSATGTGIANAVSTTSFTIGPTTTPTGTTFGTQNPKTNTPAITAGSVVGVTLLILAIAAFVYIRGRRSRPAMGHVIQLGEIDALLDMTQRHSVAPNSPLAGEAALGIPQGGSQEPASRPLPPVPVKTFVGGAEVIEDSPPKYQEHY